MKAFILKKIIFVNALMGSIGSLNDICGWVGSKEKLSANMLWCQCHAHALLAYAPSIRRFPYIQMRTFTGSLSTLHLYHAFPWKKLHDPVLLGWVVLIHRGNWLHTQVRAEPTPACQLLPELYCFTTRYSIPKYFSNCTLTAAYPHSGGESFLLKFSLTHFY